LLASTTFALVDAKKSLLKDGFFTIDDSMVGEYVLEIHQRTFPFASEYGLEFCRLNMLDDRLSAYTINPRILVRMVRSRILYEIHQGSGSHISFRKGGAKAGLRVLIVQSWSIGSRVAYYDGSHLYSLSAVQAANSLWEVPSAPFQPVIG